MKLLFNKLSQSYWLRSGAFKLFERVSNVASGFILFFVLVRNTSQAEFGSYYAFILLTSLIENLRYGFICNGLIRYLNHTDSREDYIRVETGALTLNLLLTLLISVVLWFGSEEISALLNVPLMGPMLEVFAFVNLLMVPIFHLEMMQRANMDFKGSSLGQFVYRAVFALSVVIYVLSVEAVALRDVVILMGVGIVAGTFVTAYFGKKYLSFTWRFSWSTLKEQFHYGKYTFGTFVSAYLMKSIDSWMLAFLINPAAVAVYSLAQKISTIFDAPANTVSTVIFPKMVRAIKEEGVAAARPYYEKSIAILIAIMLPCVLFTLLFAEEIVLLIGEARYAESIPVLQLTVLFGLLLPMDKQVGVLLDATGKQKMNTLFVFRNAVLNVVLNYIFIMNMGIIGAALATLTTYVISVILNQLYINRVYNISALGSFRYIGYSYGKAWTMLNKKLKGIQS